MTTTAGIPSKAVHHWVNTGYSNKAIFKRFLEQARSGW
jgi:hypothetical protein